MTLEQIDIFEVLADKFLNDPAFKELNEQKYYQQIEDDLLKSIKGVKLIKLTHELKEDNIDN